MASIGLVGCLDDAVPDLESGPVVALVDGLDDPDDRSTADGTAQSVGELDRCPVDGVASLLDDALVLVDEPVTRAAFDGVESVRVEQDDVGRPLVVCALTGTTVDGSQAEVGLWLARAPESLGEFAVAVLAPSGTGSTDVRLARRYRGGRFHDLCAIGTVGAEPGDPSATSDACSVVWVGGPDQDADREGEEPRSTDEDHALVGVFVSGPGAAELNTNEIEERWRLILPLVIERLAERDG